MAQAVGIAEDAAAERVVGKEEGFEVVVDELGGRIVVALNLVDDHLHLLVEFLLGEGAVEDDVQEQGDGALQVLAQEGGIVDGLFLARVGVEVAAHALHAVQDLHGCEALGALEGHVLHKVRHTALAVQLMARAGGHGNAGIDNIRGRGGQDDAKTVI